KLGGKSGLARSAQLCGGRTRRMSASFNRSTNNPPHSTGGETRIDPPHSLRRAGTEAPRRVAVGAAANTAADAAPLAPLPAAEFDVAQHAADLAERLQHQQEELDRRTAMLAAQEAQIE